LRTTERSPNVKRDATTAACPVSLAHQADQERTESQANLAFPARPASLVALRWRFARKCHHHRANRAHQVHPDQRVPLAMLVRPDQTATLAALERMAETAHPAQLAPTEHQAALAKTERRDQPATQPLVSHRPPEMLDPLVRTAQPVPLVKTAHLVQMEALAQLVPKAHPARLARTATTALPATRDHQAQTAPRENRVFAPNIAPPTEAFSSKTEQGDKRSQSLHRFCFTDEKPVIFMSIVFYFSLFYKSTTTAFNTAAASPVISFGAF